MQQQWGLPAPELVEDGPGHTYARCVCMGLVPAALLALRAGASARMLLLLLPPPPPLLR